MAESADSELADSTGQFRGIGQNYAKKWPIFISPSHLCS